eukprot:650443-Amphidinium_carterae.3
MPTPFTSRSSEVQMMRQKSVAQMVAKIPMSAPMLKIIGDQTLKETGATSTISASSVRKIMHQLGY